MHGNVREWCRGACVRYDETEVRPDDGEHLGAGHLRTLRGGSWNEVANAARSPCGCGVDPSHRSNEVGVRPARPAH